MVQPMNAYEKTRYDLLDLARTTLEAGDPKSAATYLVHFIAESSTVPGSYTKSIAKEIAWADNGYPPK